MVCFSANMAKTNTYAIMLVNVTLSSQNITHKQRLLYYKSISFHDLIFEDAHNFYKLIDIIM